MIRIVHIITGLAPDGAEQMLVSLITRMDRSRFENTVISLTDVGALGADICAADIPVVALGLQKRGRDAWRLGRLGLLLRQMRPDVVQTWMYHADLLGGVAGFLATKAPIIWGIHHAGLKRESNKRTTLLVARLCALLSRDVPAKIVCCSNASRTGHIAFGYKREKTATIANGFDIQKFRPDPRARAAVREQSGIESDRLVIGMAARYHSHKDHHTFLQAAAEIARDRPAVRFLLCGADVSWDNRELADHIQRLNLRGRVILLGRRTDMAQVYNGIDIATSSSKTEAFPLAVGEAMATGIPCVVTNVGDSQFLVGDTGMVVAPQSPRSLAAGWRSMLDLNPAARAALGTSARQRIATFFSLGAVVAQYEALYASVCAKS